MQPFSFPLPGGQGFSIHHDPADTYIVQLEGVKHWKVWPTPNIRPTLARNYNADDLGPPALEFALQPGDVLYMPYGTPHVTAAEDKPSLHATFVVEPTMWSNLLLRVVNEVLDSGKPSPGSATLAVPIQVHTWKISKRSWIGLLRCSAKSTFGPRSSVAQNSRKKLVECRKIISLRNISL